MYHSGMHEQMRLAYQRRGWVPGTFCPGCGHELAAPEEEPATVICPGCGAEVWFYQGKMWQTAYIMESGNVVFS